MKSINVILLYLDYVIFVHGQDCIGFVGNKRFFDWTLDDGESRTRTSTAWRYQDVAGGTAFTIMFKNGNNPAEVDPSSDYVGRLFESNTNTNDVGMELINLKTNDAKIYSVLVTFNNPPTTTYYKTLKTLQSVGDGINAIQNNCTLFVNSTTYVLGADIPSIDGTVDWGFTCPDCLTPYVNVSLTLLDDTASMVNTEECSEVIRCEQKQKTIGPGFTLSYVVGYGDFIGNWTSVISGPEVRKFKILPPTIPPVVIEVAITITVCVAAFFCIVKPVKDGKKGFSGKERHPRRDTWLVLGLAGILVIVIICVVVLVVVSMTPGDEITDDDWTIVVSVNVVFAACCIIAIIVFGCIVDNKFLKCEPTDTKCDDRNGATSAASTVTSGAVEPRVEVSEEPRKQRKLRRNKEESEAIPEPDPSERHGKLDPIYKPGSVPVQDVPSPRRLPDLNSQRSPRPLPGITNNKISPHNSTTEL